MNYNKKERSKAKVNHRPGPTYSVESHDKWASRYIWALDQVHEVYPPSNFLTIGLGKEDSVEVEKFKKKLRLSISNKKGKNKGFSMAYFGVFEILMDCSVHLHILVRDFNKDCFDNFLKRYNKRNCKSYSMKYWEPVITAEGASKYSFKLGKNSKILFKKRSLHRYTITGGRYFPLGIKYYQDKGRKSYFSKKEQEYHLAGVCSFSSI